MQKVWGFCVLIAFKGDLWEGAGLRGLGVPAHPIKVLSVLVMGHSGRPPSAWCPFSGEPEPRRQAGEGRRRCPLLLTLAAGSIRVHPGLSGLSVPRVESAPCPFLNPSSLTFLIF